MLCLCSGRDSPSSCCRCCCRSSTSSMVVFVVFVVLIITFWCAWWCILEIFVYTLFFFFIIIIFHCCWTSTQCTKYYSIYYYIVTTYINSTKWENSSIYIYIYRLVSIYFFLSSFWFLYRRDLDFGSFFFCSFVFLSFAMYCSMVLNLFVVNSRVDTHNTYTLASISDHCCCFYSYSQFSALFHSNTNTCTYASYNHSSAQAGKGERESGDVKESWREIIQK